MKTERIQKARWERKINVWRFPDGSYYKHRNSRDPDEVTRTKNLPEAAEFGPVSYGFAKTFDWKGQPIEVTITYEIEEQDIKCSE